MKTIQKQDPPGRFLEFNAASGCWTLVPDKRAVDKTSQTPRENYNPVTVSQEVPSEKVAKPKFRSTCATYTAYFRQMDDASMLANNNTITKPSPSVRMKYSLNNLNGCNVMSDAPQIGTESTSSFSSLYSYNNLILANLQNEHSPPKRQFPFNESRSTHQQQHQYMDCNNYLDASSNICNSIELDDGAEIDDEILMSIMQDMDFDADCSGISCMPTNSSINYGMKVPSSFSRKSYFNAAA